MIRNTLALVGILAIAGTVAGGWRIACFIVDGR